MEPNKIGILSPDEFGIIKQIMIISEMGGNPIGYILYERKMTNTYGLSGITKDKKDLNYYLNYPMQELYPVDNADQIILQAIKNAYPNSFARNYQRISYIDKDRIASLKMPIFEDGTISISPDFSSFDLSNLSGKEFDGLQINIRIYKLNSREGFLNPYFLGYYDLEDKVILAKFSNIKFI